jgi:protein-tyrosine kinase
MNTIEQAARRLEQLRRSGIAVDQTESQGPQPVAEPTLPALETGTGSGISLSDLAKPAERIDFPPIDGRIALSDLPAVGNGVPQPTAPLPSRAPGKAEDVEPGSSAAELVPGALVKTGPHSRTQEIDLLRMSRAGVLVPGTPRSQLEEEFRIIKRPLLENIRGQTAARPHRANLIMVTSALPGEGKTQTAINLAVSIALELDHSVLLVEADVIRPTTLSRLGLQARRGLIDLLENADVTLPDVLIRTNIPKLTLLPAGPASGRATELLASSAMNTLLEELASKYADRVIVFDSPPLLLTSEARVLATHMGQVVMVVEADKTQVGSIKQAYATLEDHPVVMSVLNKYQGPKGNAYGYYAP